MVKVGLLSSLTAATGNAALVKRLQSHFAAASHEVVIFDANSFKQQSMFLREVARHHVSIIFGIHLWRAGSLLVDSRLRFVLILGGTDVNEHSKKEEYQPTMTEAIKQSLRVVAFHEGLISLFNMYWPQFMTKVIWISPAVEVFVPKEYDFPERPSFLLRERLGYKPTDVIFLLPCNLRAVKDPLFLVDEFETWHSTDQRIQLLMIGPALDANYTQQFLAKIQGLKGIKYHPAVPAIQLQEAMMQSHVIVNSSISEGLATVILEAFFLNKPVIARNNIGNAAVVTHNITGILFSTPQEFRLHAKKLISSPDLQRTLTRNARDLVAARYSLEAERKHYQSLLHTIAASSMGKISKPSRL